MNGVCADRLRGAGHERDGGRRPKGAVLNRAADALRARGRGRGRRRWPSSCPGGSRCWASTPTTPAGAACCARSSTGFCLVARAAARRPDRAVIDVGVRGEAVGSPLDPDLSPRAGHWSNYPMTVARRVARNFPGARRGADIAFVSDLPPAAGHEQFQRADGRRSSWPWPRSTASRPRRRVPAEHPDARGPGRLSGHASRTGRASALAGDRGVGTFGGSEDHTAILCCNPGSSASTASARSSGSGPSRCRPATCSPSAQRRGGGEDRRGARHLQPRVPGSRGDPRRVAPRDPSRRPFAGGGRGIVARRRRSHQADSRRASRRIASLAGLRDRFEQFLDEHASIIPAVGDALASGDLDAAGRLVDRSQNAERWLGNQVPETVFLARSAREHGAVAASAFGAGFGGSVWALVRDDRLDVFERAWSEAFRREFPAMAGQAAFFSSPPGPAVVRVTD